MDDPIGYFDHSVTQMHGVPRAELEPLQRAAMARRFAQHRESIGMVGKLADRLGIREVVRLEDLGPLLFPHTVFKSYPASLLDKKRFDLMTKWLAKVTSYDLSNVDTRRCASIDARTDPPCSETPLQGITSPGPTGTRSVVPNDATWA